MGFGTPLFFTKIDVFNQYFLITFMGILVYTYEFKTTFHFQNYIPFSKISNNLQKIDTGFGEMFSDPKNPKITL